MDGDKEMNLRYAGKCALCGEEIRQGVRAIYNTSMRSVLHSNCNAGLDRGVADWLDRLAEVGVVALHDGRIRGTRANIDHIAITPWGVWVIDAKRYLNKRPELVTEGGFLGLGGTARLKVGGRKKDELVDVEALVGPIAAEFPSA